tara:strand:- start:241 stop:501 length:261 start_codon:yes stop_codon:yes gene_type:complete
MNYKSDIRNHLKDVKSIDFTKLISTIILLYGEDQQIDESVLENILINILTEDVYNIACFIYNTPKARHKLKWHYYIQEGEGYITSK